MRLDEQLRKSLRLPEKYYDLTANFPSTTANLFLGSNSLIGRLEFSICVHMCIGRKQSVRDNNDKQSKSPEPGLMSDSGNEGYIIASAQTCIVQIRNERQHATANKWQRR
jgi:hypothetical protein